jgi:hypothetical protein
MKKNIYKILSIVIALIIVQSCGDELTPKIYNKLTPENFPATDADMEASVTSIYSVVKDAWVPGNYNHCHFTLNTLCTDVLITAWGGSWQDIDNFLWTEHTQAVKDTYSRYTKGITKATLLLDLFNKNEIANKNLQKRFIAEVKLLRAYFALQLYDLFGPVPIVTDVEIATDIKNIDQSERPSSEYMVKFIETEINETLTELPISYSNEADYGRLTRGTALTMLMKLYLHEKEFGLVKSTITKIEELKTYELNDSYIKNFETKYEGNSNKEFIFTIPQIADGMGHSWHACVMPQTPKYVSTNGISLSIWGGLKSPWSFYDTFEENKDERLKKHLLRYYIGKGSDTLVDFRKQSNTKAIGACPLKYIEDPDHIGSRQGNDFIIYRYADVILAKAEAINELDGPTKEVVDLVNSIRNRAKATPIPESGWIKSTMRDYILDERARELFCEGVRRADLIRHGKFVEKAHELLRTDAASHHVLFPIPQYVRDANPNIKQNPGY